MRKGEREREGVRGGEAQGRRERDVMNQPFLEKALLL